LFVVLGIGGWVWLTASNFISVAYVPATAVFLLGLPAE